MATVRPFVAVTYDPARIPDLADVTCPPYDVISEAERNELYERHPYNFVRIVAGREEPDDGPKENKYTRACAFFRSWQWEGMLHEAPGPALYVYRQAFDDPMGRRRRVWGLVASVSLDDEILAHERTMAGPKADRLALMQAVPANLSPIYALYREEGGRVASDLPSHSSAAPVADFSDPDGVRHTVWAVFDEAFHEKVEAALAPCPLLIADGHHRFETAQRYRDLRRASDGPGPWDAILALLVDAGTQPVCILPYHRIVRRAAAPDLLTPLEEGFELRDLGPPTPENVAAFARSLWEDRERFGLVADRLVELQPRGALGDEIPAATVARLALAPLGVGGAEDDLSFSPDAQRVLDEVVSGRARCAFLVPPVEVVRVWEVAARNGTFPEKSTYFYPKPRDGIVVRPLGPC